jgi:hypothetical protein
MLPILRAPRRDRLTEDEFYRLAEATPAAILGSGRRAVVALFSGTGILAVGRPADTPTRDATPSPVVESCVRQKQTEGPDCPGPSATPHAAPIRGTTCA